MPDRITGGEAIGSAVDFIMAEINKRSDEIERIDRQLTDLPVSPPPNIAPERAVELLRKQLADLRKTIRGLDADATRRTCGHGAVRQLSRTAPLTEGSGVRPDRSDGSVVSGDDDLHFRFIGRARVRPFFLNVQFASEDEGTGERLQPVEYVFLIARILGLLLERIAVTPNAGFH